MYGISNFKFINMIKLKQLILKYWMYIAFVISFTIDAQYQILEELLISPFWVNIIKGLGASILAYMTNKGLSNSSIFLSKLDSNGNEIPENTTEEIGGGGIKNPKQ